MLLVMSTAGIFDEEECTLTAHSQSTEDRKTHKRTDSEIHKYSALWQVTWERIDCFLPNLRQELFTPRSQPPPANASQEKAEPEKVTVEEPRPALPEMPVEGKMCGVTVLQYTPMYSEKLSLSALRILVHKMFTSKVSR